MPTVTVTGEDRAWFARCHRAWDLGAHARQNLEQLVPPPGDPLVRGFLDAFAIYYFPGMWAWDRSVVEPLVKKAYDDGGGPDSGHELLRQFQRWARNVDHFTPIKVQYDLDVAVADADDPDRHMATAGGARVRYRHRVPLAVIADDDERCWLVEHRVVSEFASGDELYLDETAIAACWAWRETELALPPAGTLYTELRISPPAIRRTAVARPPAVVTGAGARLSRSIAQMLAVDVTVDPWPDWTHCQRCAFRTPCVEMQRGEDASVLLSTGYRPRPPDDLEEGRLGGTSWGMGRGGRPPRL